MTGFALHSSGDLYVGLPTCDPKTHGIWRVSRDGSRKELFASLPVEDLPKGLAFSKDSEFPLYVTDLHDFREEKSRANCLGPEDKGGPGPNYPCILKVWRIDHHGNVDDWIESTLFYGNPESPLDHPHGVNGIVVDDKGKNVYVTVTDFGRVVKIPVKRDGSAGKPKLFFEENNPPPNPEERDLFGMDGITIGPDGNFYIVVVRTDQLVVIPPNGKSYTIVVEGHPLDGPTQLAFGKDTKDWDFAFGRGKAGKGSQSLPPLYITSGSGRRIFFYNIANALGEGNIIDGVLELLNLDVINEQEAIGLNPRPALVKVLLDDDDRDDDDDDRDDEE